MRCIFLIYLFIVYLLPTVAQYDWHTYPNSGTLPDAIRSIKIISNDQIWVGTLDNGLHLFNGQSYKVYNTKNSLIPGNRVYDIICDSFGGKWIGTNKGLALFEDETWMTYTSENSSLPGTTVISLVREEQGKIWIGTNEGVVDGIFGTIYNSANCGLPGNQILDMLIEPDGTIWFCTDKGIATYNGMIWKTYRTGSGIIPEGAASSIQRDHHGNIWVAITQGIGGHLIMFDGAEWNLISTDGDIFQGAAITDIITTINGEVWFGTHHNGIFKFDGSRWEHYRTENSDIPINQVISLSVDPYDNIWMGSRVGLTVVTKAMTLTAFSDMSSTMLLIYPNPFEKSTNIEFPNPEHEIFRFTITDMAGKVMKILENITESRIEINRGNLMKGHYIIEIDGPRTYRGKMTVY